MFTKRDQYNIWVLFEWCFISLKLCLLWYYSSCWTGFNIIRGICMDINIFVIFTITLQLVHHWSHYISLAILGNCSHPIRFGNKPPIHSYNNLSSTEIRDHSEDITGGWRLLRVTPKFYHSLEGHPDFTNLQRGPEFAKY